MSKFDRFASLASVAESVGARRAEVATPARPHVSIPADQVGRERAKNVWTIDVDRIIPDPDQPRKEFDPDALARLAASLEADGQLQPIQVRWDADAERFVVLMGERRWRAAKAAGLKSLACVVWDGPLSDDDKLSIQLVENCVREDLAPVEQARAFRELMDRRGLTAARLADQLSISQSRVSQALSLLALPADVQARVDAGDVPPSVAYEISKVDDPAEQVRLATAVAEQGLTRADVARQARRKPSARKPAATAKRHPPARVWRVDGVRVEVSRKAGVDPATAEAALLGALERLRAENADSPASAA